MNGAFETPVDVVVALTHLEDPSWAAPFIQNGKHILTDKEADIVLEMVQRQQQEGVSSFIHLKDEGFYPEYGVYVFADQLFFLSDPPGENICADTGLSLADYGINPASNPGPEVLERLMSLLPQGKGVLIFLIMIYSLFYEIFKHCQYPLLRLQTLISIVAPNGSFKTSIIKAICSALHSENVVSIPTASLIGISRTVTQVHSYCAIADDARPVRFGATDAETKKKIEFLTRTTGDDGAARKTATYSSDINGVIIITAEAEFWQNASTVKRITQISFGNRDASLPNLTWLQGNRFAINSLTYQMLRYGLENDIVDVVDILFQEKLPTLQASYSCAVSVDRIIQTHALLLAFGEFWADFFQTLGLSEQWTESLQQMETALADSKNKQVEEMIRTSPEEVLLEALASLMEPGTFSHATVVQHEGDSYKTGTLDGVVDFWISEGKIALIPVRTQDRLIGLVGSFSRHTLIQQLKSMGLLFLSFGEKPSAAWRIRVNAEQIRAIKLDLMKLNKMLEERKL